jgi:hypothetical protein
MAVRLDVVEQILRNLEKSQEMESLIGSPVLDNLVIAADKSDINIEHSGRKELSREQSDRFLKILDEIIDRSVKECSEEDEE